MSHAAFEHLAVGDGPYVYPPVPEMGEAAQTDKRDLAPIPDRAEKRGKLPLPHHEGGDDQASPKRAVADHFEGRNPVQQIPVQRAQAEGQVHAEKDAHALPLREAARSSAG